MSANLSLPEAKIEKKMCRSYVHHSIINLNFLSISELTLFMRNINYSPFLINDCLFDGA